jgi:hypothetical protein
MVLMQSDLNFLRPQKTEGLIRLGREKDGGYIVLRDIILRTKNLVSFGLGYDLSFEVDFHKLNPSAGVVVYDHTISVPNIQNIIKQFVRLVFFRINFATLIECVTFFAEYKRFFRDKRLHKIQRINSHCYQKFDTTCDDIFKQLDSDVVVKMDIEGDEYKILPFLLKHISQISLIIIEFHQIESRIELFEKIIKDIQSTCMVVHVHANNIGDLTINGIPETLEITFSKINPEITENFITELPNSLYDYPNDPKLRDFQLNWR